MVPSIDLTSSGYFISYQCRYNFHAMSVRRQIIFEDLVFFFLRIFSFIILKCLRVFIYVCVVYFLFLCLLFYLSSVKDR